MTQLSTKDGEPVFDTVGDSVGTIWLALEYEEKPPLWLDFGRSQMRVSVEQLEGIKTGNYGSRWRRRDYEENRRDYEENSTIYRA